MVLTPPVLEHSQDNINRCNHIPLLEAAWLAAPNVMQTYTRIKE